MRNTNIVDAAADWRVSCNVLNFANFFLSLRTREIGGARVRFAREVFGLDARERETSWI